MSILPQYLLEEESLSGSTVQLPLSPHPTLAPLQPHRPPSFSPTCGMPHQGLHAGRSLSLRWFSLHTCSPTPIRSLLRCHLPREASLTTPQGQTRPGPLDGQHTLVVYCPFSATLSPGCSQERGWSALLPMTSPECRLGTEWGLLPWSTGRRWGGPC